jgi:reactive chlorine resistance protein C
MPHANVPATSPAHLAAALQRIGRIVALLGIVLPLLLIGGLKFTTVEVQALAPLIGGTPWLAWLYPLLGAEGASYALGIVEIAAALFVAAAPWSPRVGLIGGALAATTFLVTTSILFALPVWEDAAGGFPALNGLGQFLIKDLALLGISLVVAGECLARSIRR